MNAAIIPIPRNLVVVCLADHPKALLMLRIARRRAQECDGKWRAVFIETPSHLRALDEGARERQLRLLTMAEQMGAETALLEADSVEKGLASVLEKEASRIGLVIIGSTETQERRWSLGAPLWKRLVRIANMYTETEVVRLSGHKYHRTLADRLHLHAVHLLHCAYALLAVGTASLAAFTLQWFLPPALFRINDQNVALIYMIACAFIAGRFGLLPGLVASVASFLTVNYFFMVPYYVLKLDGVTDILNMALFLSAALLISLFTSQTRGYAREAAKRELSTQALFTLYRVASDAFSREQAMEKLQRKLERMLKVDVAFFLPSALAGIEPAFPAGLTLQEADRKALDACWAELKTTGAASPFNPGTAWRFEPMMSPAGEIGVLGVRPRKRGVLDGWFGRLLTAIADQTATVLEHIGLERSMEEARLREEREKLRAMLLSSISHDFKTPLAGIIGALSVYRSLGDRLSEQKRQELMEAAIEEAQRLDSFITNILDMTRLESGNVQFRKEWFSLSAMINGVTKRLQNRLRQHAIVVQPFPATIETYLDMMMMEQVMQNLLDNACKYTAPGTQIEVACRVEEGTGVLCTVRDHGGGLPPDKMDRIFDKYARLHKKDTQVAGTGLGLAISKAIMEAQGGWITAANHPEGGAVFTLCIPQWRNKGRKNIGNGAGNASG